MNTLIGIFHVVTLIFIGPTSQLINCDGPHLSSKWPYRNLISWASVRSSDSDPSSYTSSGPRWQSSGSLSTSAWPIEKRSRTKLIGCISIVKCFRLPGLCKYSKRLNWPSELLLLVSTSFLAPSFEAFPFWLTLQQRIHNMERMSSDGVVWEEQFRKGKVLLG